MTKDEKEKPDEKVKDEPKNGEFTLMQFKIDKNLSNMDYAGLKSHLDVDDDAVLPKTKLNKALKEYAQKPAFIQKVDKEE